MTDEMTGVRLLAWRKSSKCPRWYLGSSTFSRMTRARSNRAGCRRLALVPELPARPLRLWAMRSKGCPGHVRCAPQRRQLRHPQDGLVKAYNEKPKPFVWVKTADKILGLHPAVLAVLLPAVPRDAPPLRRPAKTIPPGQGGAASPCGPTHHPRGNLQRRGGSPMRLRGIWQPPAEMRPPFRL